MEIIFEILPDYKNLSTMIGNNGEFQRVTTIRRNGGYWTR